MRWIIVWALLFLPLSAESAGEKDGRGDTVKVATVINLKGTLKRLKEGSIKKVRLKAGDGIDKGDMVMTYGSASALLQLLDGSTLLMDEDSMVHFHSSVSVEQTEGAVYYEVLKRSSHSALKVKTPFAIIGIKGTTFIVNAGENPNVALNEGRIGIESLKEAFELHRKKVLREFEDFKARQESGFDAYKKAQDKHIVEHVKAFELEAGNSVYFENNRVDELPISETTQAQFEHFRALMRSLR